MTISSPAFQHEGFIPSTYTCDGENINPPLIFSDVPAQAKSLVLLMDDPDVPTSIRPDGMWDHWVVVNMPADTVGIDAGTEPSAVIGMNTGGRVAYGGPCPPDREHRYFFTLYALDTMLQVSSGIAKRDVEALMRGHVLAEAVLMGRYVRQ